MAQGDLTLSSPKTISVSGLQFDRLVLRRNSLTLWLVEAGTGKEHVVYVDDAGCSGLSYDGTNFVDGVAVNVTGEFTKVAGLVFKANPFKQLIQTLQTDGIVGAAGAVG